MVRNKVGKFLPLSNGNHGKMSGKNFQGKGEGGRENVLHL